MSGSTTWWWIRHGPTHAKTMVGWRDLPADLSNVKQLQRLSNFLPKGALMMSSDLCRAAQTARALHPAPSEIIVNPDLREFNFGAWDGLDWQSVAARDPELSRLFWEQPGDHQAPEGESWNQLSARVDGIVQQINRLGHKHVVAVAHFGVILTRIAQTGITPYNALSHPIDNLSVTTTSWDGTRWSLDLINHLP